MANISLISTIGKRLQGKVALITGGASGIGACTAKLFSENGAKVVIADIQDKLAAAVCKNLTSATAVHCDVTEESDIENAVNTTIAKYGKLDIMLNNAGIVGPINPNILENDKAEFEKVLAVNTVGAFFGTKHAARVMIPNRQGSIITTASVCSTIGGVASHAYTTSKHGVVGLMRNTAVELGKFGIRVNCVSPYVVPTPLVMKILDEESVLDVYSGLKGKNLTAEDVAEAMVYLGSDESKYVSGLNMIIDGGFVVHNTGFSLMRDSN